MKRLSAAICAAALLTVSACTSDSNEPDPEPTVTAPSEPAPSPAPTRPANAMDDSTSAAATTMGLWVESLNHAATTGDVSGLDEFSSPDCEPCNGFKDEYRDAGPEDLADGPIWIIDRDRVSVFPDPPLVAQAFIEYAEAGNVIEREVQFLMSDNAPFILKDIVFVERSQ